MSALVFRGKLNAITFVMHGEDRTGIDNRYYDEVLRNLNGDEVLLVEHSTIDTTLLRENESLFRTFAKGSEWVFYKQAMSNYPKLFCFDNRVELGYLHTFQEETLMVIGQRLHEAHPMDISSYLEKVTHTIDMFKQDRLLFDMAFPGYFEPSLKIVTGQLDRVKEILAMPQPSASASIIGTIGYDLAANLRLVASLSVDIFLMAILMNLSQKSELREIHVFASKNHVVRMSGMLPFYDCESQISPEDIRNASMVLKC